MDTVKIGIIGTGWIAEKMAITLEGMEGVEAMQSLPASCRLPVTLPTGGVSPVPTVLMKKCWMMKRWSWYILPLPILTILNMHV